MSSFRPPNIDAKTASEISGAVSAAFDDFVAAHFPSTDHLPSMSDGAWKVTDDAWTYVKVFRCSCGETQQVTLRMKG